MPKNNKKDKVGKETIYKKIEKTLENKIMGNSMRQQNATA